MGFKPFLPPTFRKPRCKAWFSGFSEVMKIEFDQSVFKLVDGSWEHVSGDPDNIKILLLQETASAGLHFPNEWGRVNHIALKLGGRILTPRESPDEEDQKKEDY